MYDKTNNKTIGETNWKDILYADTILKNLLCYDDYPINAYDNLAYIETIFIEQNYRGKNLSKKLIKKTLAYIRKEKRYRHIALQVSPYDNGLKKRPLLNLYKKFNFKRIMYTDLMIIKKKK